MKYAHVRATRKDLVLDVGSGAFPHSTADILVEKFIDDTLGHRSGKAVILDRPLVQADIIELPFKDKSFDYVIANQIIEHLPRPTKALAEISRIGQRGFISVPTEFLEMICPHAMHLWVFAKIGDELLVKKKQEIHSFGVNNLYGNVFWMLHEDPGFKRFMLEHSNLFFVNLEWEDVIHFREVPNDFSFYDYLDRDSVTSLLELTYPENIVEFIKWQLRSNLDLRSWYHITHIRTFFRKMSKNLHVG